MASKTSEKKSESKVTGLTDAQLKEAADALENGRPRPAGVSYSPYRTPVFLSESEQEEYDRTGVMPESAVDRVETERKIVGHFDFRGNRLSTEAVLEGYATGLAPTIENRGGNVPTPDNVGTSPAGDVTP